MKNEEKQYIEVAPGKKAEVIGTVHSKALDRDVPLVDLKMMSDQKWVEGCIKSREEHPEYYPNENIPEVLEQQYRLLEHLKNPEDFCSFLSESTGGRVSTFTD